MGVANIKLREEWHHVADVSEFDIERRGESTPSAVANASAMKTGSHTTFAVGTTPFRHMSANSTGKASAKSTSPASTVATESSDAGSRLS